MLAIFKVVFKKEDDLREGTDCYIDDILVDETAEPASKFVSHLDKFGLTVKPPESLERGAALDLQLDKDEAGNQVFTRKNEILEVHEEMSRCELFSACEKQVGHYSVAGWLT